jgi:serine protein kinase
MARAKVTDLQTLGASVRERFQAEKRLLSFDEYITEVLAQPYRHTRDAARYVHGCFDHFGSYEVSAPWGKQTRYRLFDQDFVDVDGGEGRPRLIGHERIQEAFYRALSNFVREGRANRLLLLHGPNGSAKSTFAACIMRALESYSATEEGALYRFSWVFPGGFDDRSIGFDARPKRQSNSDSYAHLEHDKISAKVTSELREHPLLLLPIPERRTLLRDAYKAKGVEGSAPDWVWNGRLGHKNAQIFDAMLANYAGDLSKVLAHVQVERYYVSRRYRTGVVTIGPQMSVDAGERQVTMDRTLGSLPGALLTLSLFETQGELVDGAGGVIEFSDLLKRPLESWKYLLLAIETGEVSLSHSTLAVNSVFMGSTNESHLEAFRQHPEYNSFRARLQLLRLGYLLDYTREEDIYKTQIVPQVRTHVAPHAIYVAGLWSVLTRLLPSDVAHYEDPVLGKIAAGLTPMEKAMLYAHGDVPRRLGTDEAKVLRAGVDQVVREFESLPIYEGITGASPREVRTLILDAAQHPLQACLSPLGVIEQIEMLCEKGDYAFLKHKPDSGFHDHRSFVTQVRDSWMSRLDAEVRTSTGLVEEARHEELFSRYVTHVSMWVKGERARDAMTGRYEDPDQSLLKRIEETLEVENVEEFRRNLISVVAAYAIDHPGATPEPSVIFPQHLERVKESYFSERRGHVAAMIRDMLDTLSEGQREVGLDGEARKSAERAVERMIKDYGYCRACARASLGELQRVRYADA